MSLDIEELKEWLNQAEHSTKAQRAALYRCGRSRWFVQNWGQNKELASKAIQHELATHRTVRQLDSMPNK